MNYFPAAPGILIAQQDPEALGGILHFAVVGWCSVQGNLAFPVTVMPFKGLTHGNCLLYPDGHVEDPTHEAVFESIVDWDQWINTQHAPKDKPAPAAAQVEPREKTPVQTGKIGFGDKSYTTTSFWKVPDMKCVFKIEGGEVYPKDKRAEKVKRDDFMALKREGWTMIDPHSGVVDEELPPANEEPEVNEDDDDGSDLV